MADGVSHRRFLDLGWGIALPVSFWFSGLMYIQGYNYWFSLIFCIWNYWLCRLIDPDLDLLGASTAESTGMKILRKIPIIGWILVASWMAYTTFYAGIIYSLGGHRSIASHSLIIGTIGRMIFFNIPFWLFIYWERLRTGNVWNFREVYSDWRMDIWLYPYYFSQFLMLSIGDAIHLLLDTEMVKGILYQPKKNNEEVKDFKPKWGNFVDMILRMVFAYSWNKIHKIFRKQVKK